MFRCCKIVLAVLCVGFSAGPFVSADVFNMGGTRDPTTGTWTGLASLDMVPVGNPGNAADPATGSLYGAVPYSYSIGKYDVTNAQYCQFLNAKAASGDPYGLWNWYMGNNGDAEGGINRSGSGPYTYTVKAGQGNQPIVDVTWYDAIRFTNWLTNGQGNGDTESGTYAITGSGPNWTVAVPSASQRATWAVSGQAHWLLPSDDEWYKAAYYDPTLNSGSGGYWPYPTKSNIAPTSQAPSGGSNSANFNDSTTGYALTGSTSLNPSFDYLTDVGAYPNSVGAYGTFDQGGDVWQWNDTLIGSSRGFSGGSWSDGSYWLAASGNWSYVPTSFYCSIGFRVASVPEPGSVTLLLVGAIALLAYGWRRQKRTA
jgi:formylglycine-generating enzyme required for sulfatase activity